MKIQSMTGFGRGQSENDHYMVTVEVKSVNHRFKEIRFKMSSYLNSQEVVWRNLVEKKFKRGTFDIFINYTQNPKAVMDFNVDQNKIQTFLEQFKKIGINHTSINPTDFLRPEFQRDDVASKQKELVPLVEQALIKALDDLEKSRFSEGQKLASIMLQHLNDYQNLLDVCDRKRLQYPEILREKLTQKLNEKLKEFKLDESRLMQEILYYLEKLEVDEEISRAKVHLQKFHQVLSAETEIGRQLDFLLQELGRETNTLGSKSSTPEISQNVVEMKVQLEKMREQALNIE